MSADQYHDILFRLARSHNGWTGKPVSDETLRELYELMKWGPTSVNCSPARITFVRTPGEKARLKEALSPGNVDKATSAPVIAIVGYDTRFYEQLPRLFPHNPGVKAWFEGEAKSAFAYTTALRNSSMQGGYLIAAARMLGLDCGPMSGFDNAKVDAAFFPDGTVKSNFICALGYGDPAKLHARGPRLAFEEACTLS